MTENAGVVMGECELLFIVSKLVKPFWKLF